MNNSRKNLKIVNMKQLLVLLIFSVSAFGSKAQDITGQWNGAFEVQGMQDLVDWITLIIH